jgi:CDP-diacylglycerol---glycerol-3-phosphate 3-phosphatidyltransferase
MRTARRYSTAETPSMASSTPQSQASMLATITTDLDNIAPRFEIQPEQITIIKTPADFYETLKVGFDSKCHALLPSSFFMFSLTVMY